MGFRQPLLLGAMSAANILSAILFQWLLLTLLGPGQMTDAFFAAMTVPQIFATVVSSSLAQVLVPLLAGETKEHARRTIWTLLVLLCPAFSAIAALLALTAQWWAPITVFGFSVWGKAATANLAQIMVIGMVFTGINSVQIAASFARGHYIWPDLAQMISNLVALVCLIVLLPHFGVIAAAWITVCRALLQTLLLINSLGRPTRPDLNDAKIRATWRRMKPLLLGASYYKMDPLVDRFLLSSLAPGSLSLFYLAQQLYSAASQVLVKAFAVPANTRMAVAFKAGDAAGFAMDLRLTSYKMIGLSLFAVAILALAGKPILSGLLDHGQFGQDSVRLLWMIMLLSAGQFVWGAVGSLVTGAFYARGNTVTPTILGAVSFTVAIVLKAAFIAQFGIHGLALAVTLFFTLSIALLYRFLYRLPPIGRHSASQTTKEKQQ
jgi:putative peptidoglycan lipid II flippase